MPSPADLGSMTEFVLSSEALIERVQKLGTCNIRCDPNIKNHTLYMNVTRMNYAKGPR